MEDVELSPSFWKDKRVLITSDKCYENREWPWGYRENEPMGGHDPYSSSKGCAELGWQPRLDLQEALSWTVDWYKCFEAGGDLRARTENQIAGFESGQRLV